MRIRSTSLRVVVIACAVVGCGRPAPSVDMEARFDHEVETRWRAKWPCIDAIPHLQHGGFYMTDMEGGGPEYDRLNVVPLLTSLQDEFSLHWIAVVHQKERAMTLALIAEIPADPSARERIDASLDKHQQTFPGAILVQWGHRWLSLDFLTAEQETFLEGNEQESEK